MPEAAELRRLAVLRSVVCLSFLASLALSRSLWTGDRFYPRLPAYDATALCSGTEFALTAALLACLGACTLGRAPKICGPLAAGCALVLVAGDVTRLQPWVYQWTAALLVLSCDPARARERLVLLLSAVYVHSALAKLGDGFATGPFAFILSPFLDPNALSRSLLLMLAGLSIAAELGLGLLLLARRTRLAAALGLMGMHAFLLLSLGPFGNDWNAVVWPWNAGMLALLPLVAIGYVSPVRLRGNGTLLLLFGLCPLLRPFGWWDHYVSFALYSGDKPNGILFMSDAAHDALPAEVREWARGDVVGYRLSFKTWAMGELGVPPYPEEHAYRAALRRFLAQHPNPYDVELEITLPPAFEGETRVQRTTY